MRNELPSAKEMQSYDSATIEAGTDSLVLMERAGRSIFEFIIDNYKDCLHAGSILTILAGPGNNGGDGLVIARYLLEKGCFVKVVVAASDKYSVEFSKQLSNFRDCVTKSQAKLTECLYLFGENRSELDSLSELSSVDKKQLKQILAESAVVVDALLGTGTNSEPRGEIGAIIETVDRWQTAESAPIISVDVPSGLNVDSGQAYSPCISADSTVAIELIKRGMLQHPAKVHCGEISQISIGIKVDGASQFELLCEDTVAEVPVRNPNSHKGSFGQVFVVGGCRLMPGAPMLSAYSALRSGAGTVYMTSFVGGVQLAAPAELMHIPILDKEYFDSECFPLILSRLEKASAAVIGPGFGSSEKIRPFLAQVLTVLQEKNIPAVIDADALNHLALEIGKDGFELRNHVITPHPGEAARLLKTSTEQVQADRYKAVEELYLRTGATVVLKGASSIVYHGEKGWVNQTGNPYMATAGSGDVLAGIIASLLAQGLDCVESAKLGTFVHGLAGDRAHAQLSGPIIASDIIEAIPGLL
ncbi:MAG: NAD(P)H-hydrate dehydratase [Deltaproteobacteria bacterium]|nr:NAD(P)H-hydrate dehydratase [Deltaproteobacteria bacterium]